MEIIANRLQRKLEQIGPDWCGEDRSQFWNYARGAVAHSRHRARKSGIPHTIDSHDIERLLVDQDWRCAISGLPLDAPRNGTKKRTPFGPSLDRIRPALGYVPGNLRILCNVVNFAINEWGEEAFYRVARAMIERHEYGIFK